MLTVACSSSLIAPLGTENAHSYTCSISLIAPLGTEHAHSYM